MSDFIIKKLLFNAFSQYVSIPVKKHDVTHQANLKKQINKELTAPGANPGLRSSLLGTPIYMPVQLNGIWLPNEPLVQIDGGKEIVKEPKASGKGTFKEEMGLLDYEISIFGVAVNEVDIDEYPEKEISQIRAICETPGAIKAQSPLFRIFGVDQIVIEKWRFPAPPGEFSCQPYELSCLSDETEELLLIDNLI